ncbi:MAG: DUF1919 domain-containing protein [Dorea sp.]|nr:DUF1919 domain-containing protein [Dorea sp.]
MVKRLLRSLIVTIKDQEQILYKKRKRKRLDNLNFSIIASNCVGTIIYHDLDLPFLSPTINLTIEMDDFIRFAENLKWYMEQEIVELKGEKGCPAGMLGDVKINFVHYDTFEEGVRKWEERKERINWDNLLLIGSERDGCSYETLERFDRLPYENKVILTRVRYPEISSAYCIEGFEEKEELGMVLNYKKQFFRRRYLDDFDYVAFINSAVQKL